MANYAQGKYQVKNKHKYVGKTVPKYRSGWELTFMMFCDNHDSVLQWASESIQIPYRNPLTGKQTVYIPDFFVLYQDRLGHQRAEIVEIKPKKQSLIESRVASARERVTVALNHAKWAAAMAYCKRIGCTFRVVTEDDLFYKGKRK